VVAFCLSLVRDIQINLNDTNKDLVLHLIRDPISQKYKEEISKHDITIWFVMYTNTKLF
jgi:hypothetical protein